MKKLLSIILTGVICFGLAVPALADFEASGNVGTYEWVLEPVGESLDEPVPLPEHLAERANPDSWLIYDFDHSKLLEVKKNEWEDRIYVMLEGSTFTVYTNPSHQVTVSDMTVWPDDGESACFFSQYEPYELADMRYMPPVTITFSHDVTAPDGTVIDLAKLGETYTLNFTLCWENQGDVSISNYIEQFQVIPATAYASTQTVNIDGKAVEFQMYAIKDANGNDTNYVKVRDVALALDGTAAQFNVGYDGNVNLEKGRPYTTRNGQENNTPYSGDQPFTCSTSATNVDGENADLTAFVITDASGNGSTYYKLRDLGEALGFAVDWSAERGIYIETTSAL